ncbi:conserved hypothetical protein [Candidatus Terasakiella magnetica]|nr:conserved hypothetical protein [Candidatus Terasakiella magnetica]
MLRWLQALFLDKRARQALNPKPPPAPVCRPRAAPPPVRERDPATALAEAEARMQRLPPEKAQLIRSAMAVHRVRQSVLADLSDEERAKLKEMAEQALLGGKGA